MTYTPIQGGDHHTDLPDNTVAEPVNKPSATIDPAAIRLTPRVESPLPHRPPAEPPLSIDPPVPEKGGEGGESTPPVAPAPPLPPLPKAERTAAPPTVWHDGVFTPAPDQNPVIAALIDQGLYLQQEGGREHRVTCPLAHEHADGAGEAVYIEPDPAHPFGRYRCTGGHGSKFGIVQLLDRLGIESDDARCKPRIRLVQGELVPIVAAAERVLGQGGNHFAYGGSIATVRTNKATGDITIETANDQSLTKALSGAADWEKFDARQKAYVRTDPPPRVVQMLMRETALPSLPPLSGLARQPYFRRQDGELVSMPGYDRLSGIYASFDPAAFPMPEPTIDAARLALERLKALLSEFPFASDHDCAAALSAMLTATVRPTLPLAPAFNVTASSSGSGKSYLAETIMPFAGPGAPLNMSYPTNSDEASKAMLAAMLQNPAVVLFDDMQTDWLPLSAINKTLTSPTISERVLGSSRMATATTNSMFIGTGINIGPVRDMSRRVVSITLAPPSQSPATQRFTGRPAEQVRKHRGQYVADALTIIRAWHAAGSPKADVSEIGSYGEWSGACRQPLLWLGEPDPALSLIEQIKTDPDRQVLARFMEAWGNELFDRVVTVRTIVETAENDRNGAFRDALYDLPVVERGHVNPSRLGWYLKKNAGRNIDGFQIVQAPCSERRAWQVVPVPSS